MSHYLIKEHPEYYQWFSLYDFTWNRTGGDPITQGNRNPLLYKNLVLMELNWISCSWKIFISFSLERKGRRLTVVGSGFETKSSRSRESSKLLTYGLTNFDLVEINKFDKPIDKVDVWLGKEKQVDVYVNQDIYKTIKKAKKKLLKVALNYEGPIEAPIKKDQIIGTFKVVYDDELVGEYDLLAAQNVEKLIFLLD